MAYRSASETSISNDHGLLAKPLHVQRLEHAVRLDSFLEHVQNYFNSPLSDVDETTETEAESQSEIDGDVLDGKLSNDVLISWQERRADQIRLYNFSKVKKGRKWLKAILLSESSDSGDESDSISEHGLQEMLKFHKLTKAAQEEYHADSELKHYQYYSAGLLSNHDRFYEHQKLMLGGKKKLKDKRIEKKKSKLKKIKLEKYSTDKTNLQEFFEQDSIKQEEKLSYKNGGDSVEVIQQKPSKKKTAAGQEVIMATKRKRIWVALAKKEVCRAQKQKVAAHKEMLTTAKRLVHACQRECRKGALLSQKVMKDTPSRARRLTKEMLLYWKRYEKVEKEHRKRAEKEAQEQLRMDIELREAKRQQRKLNFLITQTELYAHFMSHKMGSLQDISKENILSKLDEVKTDFIDQRKCVLEVDDDQYDCNEMKNLALKNAENAYREHQAHTKAFDNEINSLKNKRQCSNRHDFDENFRLTNPSVSTDEDLPQPQMFVGKLKTYQLKGMNWLNNLYDKGINGILADEMGLGKTVQTIAFLATLVETQGIWGPFLIIAPASTLHNWQQEFTKFVPKFKVLPYWGNTSDRKILRKFWNQKDLHTSNASFHVLITSYQLVVQDVKYFQRIKWQYMVLDEAQAIKSTSSVRWKILLGFNCRNRLLLSGTPIQNSMAELWALLHFIMPTLFDSHEEFNEWFSKDIESHAENKSTIDEKHLSRLHMILKPFMLRRIKKDVENELSDKIEILMYCQLTQRQKLLYQALKNKISIEDLIQSPSASQSQTSTSNLMNLVMQLRKVCNHPDLFERREAKSSFFMKMVPYIMPQLLFREGFLSLNEASKKKLLIYTLNIFHPEYIHHSLFPPNSSNVIHHHDCCFSFIHFINISPSEMSNIALKGLLPRWLSLYLFWKNAYRILYKEIWLENSISYTLDHYGLLLTPLQFSICSRLENSALNLFVFTDYCTSVYTINSYILHCMPETSQHREMRHQKLINKSQSLINGTGLNNSSVPAIPKKLQSPPHTSATVPSFPRVKRSSKVVDFQPISLPSFLTDICPKVRVMPWTWYCSDINAIRWQVQQYFCGDIDVYGLLLYGYPGIIPFHLKHKKQWFKSVSFNGIIDHRPNSGWSHIIIPYKELLVTDSGKLQVLDKLLKKLKMEGHRVLIYSQMTRMIDLLEEYMWHRKHTYMRLDGSSKIADRRDMVADFQTRSDIFVFLLSTRAGGLGINLTAADTVIFYDIDWNPTVDQQAMDRAHRLGQTKQVTVYRLVCKGTIEERILQRAKEKSEIQRMVISGGNFKPDTLKHKEVVCLLLDDDELERKFQQKQEERRQQEDGNNWERKRKREKLEKKGSNKRKKLEENVTIPASSLSVGHEVDSVPGFDSVPPSPFSEHSVSSFIVAQDDTSSEGPLVVDDSSPSATPVPALVNQATAQSGIENAIGPANNLNLKKRGSGRSRGRPRGSGRRGSRGRGNTLATAAAELAAAQAGKSAAFAAYGYTLQGSSTTSSTSQHGGISRNLLHMPMRPSHQGQRYGKRSPGDLKMSNDSLPTSSSVFTGFYVQGTQL